MSEQSAGRLASWRIANIARELASQQLNQVDYPCRCSMVALGCLPMVNP
jgi:hypothetical protein